MVEVVFRLARPISGYSRSRSQLQPQLSRAKFGQSWNFRWLRPVQLPCFLEVAWQSCFRKQ